MSSGPGFQEAGRELGEEDLGSDRKPPKTWVEGSAGPAALNRSWAENEEGWRAGLPAEQQGRQERHHSAVRGEPRAGSPVTVGGGSVRGRWELTQWLEGLVQSPVPFTGNHPLVF